MDSDSILAFNAAHAMSTLLSDRLGDLQAEEITLSRDEAALCLGLVNSLLEIVKRQDAPFPLQPSPNG